MDEEKSLIRELHEANRDFAERLRESEINLTYDDEHDLYHLVARRHRFNEGHHPGDGPRL